MKFFPDARKFHAPCTHPRQPALPCAWPDCPEGAPGEVLDLLIATRAASHSLSSEDCEGWRYLSRLQRQPHSIPGVYENTYSWRAL